MYWILMPALFVFSGSGMASIGNKDVDSIAVVGGYGHGEALEPIRASRYTCNFFLKHGWLGKTYPKQSPLNL